MKTAKKAPETVLGIDKDFMWAPGEGPQTQEEIDDFFNSAAIHELKQLICELGRRSYAKNYNDGNGGNFSVRVAKNVVLCTPTMVSKGFMKPSDMCFVNMNGEKIAGSRRRTSEVLAHLAIMKRQPLAKACCHAHPPHATAFALAGKSPRATSTPRRKSSSAMLVWPPTTPPERSAWPTKSASSA